MTITTDRQTTYTATIHTTAGAPAMLEPLTRAERETVMHLARGLSNKEIAAAQYVTLKTVHRRLYMVYQKLGVVRSGAPRNQVIRYAILNGLDKPASEPASKSKN